MLLTLQDNECRIRVTIDKKSIELSLFPSADKQFACIVSRLKNKNHKVSIKGLSGKLRIDSVVIK